MMQSELVPADDVVYSIHFSEPVLATLAFIV